MPAVWESERAEVETKRVTGANYIIFPTIYGMPLWSRLTICPPSSLGQAAWGGAWYVPQLGLRLTAFVVICVSLRPTAAADGRATARFPVLCLVTALCTGGRRSESVVQGPLRWKAG